MHHHQLTPAEWDSVARDPEFQALLRTRRAFVIPATIFFLAYYFALPLGVGFAPSLMNRVIWGPLTVAYAFAFSQFVMAWVLCALYMQRAKRFDTLAAAVAKRAIASLAP